MEDAEKIILEHLKQVGCSIEVESLKDLDAETTLDAVVKCLKAIIPDFAAPSSVPHNMVAKYNLGMKLADAIVSLGFKGELGYQSFMYSNEVELRRVFTFLIEKIPKEEKVSPVQAKGFSFKSTFAAAVRSEIEKPWLPTYARDESIGRPVKTLSFREDLSRIEDPHTLMASILNENAALRAKVSLSNDAEFVKLIRIIQEKKASLQKESSMPEDVQDQATIEQEEPEAVEVRPDELAVLEERNVQLGEEMEVIDAELERVTNEMINVQVALDEMVSILAQERQTNKIKLKAHDLIGEHGIEGALKFCTDYLESLESKSMKLAVEWEEHRAPLVETLRKLRMDNSAKGNQQRSKRERMERLQRDKQRMVQEYSLKRELVKQLQAEWEKMGSKESNVTQRSSYLTRIQEIVCSVTRQKEEIEKILIENRKKQREMNLLADRSERSFAAAELFFAKQSAKSEDAKKMHRNVGEIHKDCKTIFEAVDGNGTLQREIRDLEERIDKERQSKVEQNLERITADFNQMKMENDAIETELTKKGVVLGNV
ncbi:coiled-coil domain-containing protein 22 [Galendromus occidentalis]|uniref:Coiled-coil domain-containing protein 22 homolog n=1 Tax=Galendromus occidentalis TaxID=34638 RepID=A0AAJ6QNS2_9ACAR|nr:coiled-coil domain-containing protein 22 [Galendromus occidentalis]